MSVSIASVCLLLMAFPVFILSRPQAQDPSAKNLIERIPEHDRGLFVSFHLSQALNHEDSIPKYLIKLPQQAKIPKEKYEGFKKISTDPEFSMSLLEWTKQTLNITNADVYSLVTEFSTVCFPAGCFDPNDIGSLCCPF